jgi:hypothetical protein
MPQWPGRAIWSHLGVRGGQTRQFAFHIELLDKVLVSKLNGANTPVRCYLFLLATNVTVLHIFMSRPGIVEFLSAKVV